MIIGTHLTGPVIPEIDVTQLPDGRHSSVSIKLHMVEGGVKSTQVITFIGTVEDVATFLYQAHVEYRRDNSVGQPF